MNYSSGYNPDYKPMPDAGRMLNLNTMTKVVQIIKEEDNIYLNIAIDHPEPIYHKEIPNANTPACYLTKDDTIVAEYAVSKNQSLINKASDYYLSVVRFTIPLDATPLFIMNIVPNQLDINLTPYIIGIEYNNTYFPINLSYVSKNNYLSYGPTPVQNKPLQVINPYYYVYNYGILLDMINTGLNAVWINSGLNIVFPGYLAPYVYLNANTNLISLVVPKCFGKLTAPAVSIPRIYMNTILNTYLDGFLTEYNGTGNPKGNDVYITCNITPNNAFYPPGTVQPTPTSPPSLPADPYYYRYVQEFSSLEYWTSLRRIIISSNSLPTRKQYIPVSNNTDPVLNVNNNAITASFPIIADLIMQVDNSPGLSRSICYYNPQPQYQLVDLISDADIRDIDIRLFWEDREGNLYPIEVSLLQQCSLKLGFFNKKLYKGNF